MSDIEPQTIRKNQEALESKSLQVFRINGANATVIGSTQSPEHSDAFSDTDLWVEIPNDRAGDLIAKREAIYNEIGRLLFRWERPRFAPLHGVHSVLFYDNGEDALPSGLDVYLVPRSVGQYLYDGFARPEHNSHLYKWQSGEDPGTVEDMLNYILCVSFWCSKYIARGNLDSINWLVSRYNEARCHIPQLPALSSNNNAGDENVFRLIEEVIESVTSLGIPNVVNSSKRFANAPKLGRLSIPNGLAKQLITV